MIKGLFASYPLKIVLFVVLGVVTGHIVFNYSGIVSGQTGMSTRFNLCETLIIDAETPIRTGFGSPFSFFQEKAMLGMRLLCTENAVTLVAGSGDGEEFIYEQAYHYLNGQWKRVMLRGDDTVGPWIRGVASATLDKDAMKDGTHMVVAYTCKLVQGQWKCGCRDRQCAQAFWQIQEFSYTSPETLSKTETGSVASGARYVANPSTFTAKPGSSVSVTGNGFSRNGNKVYIDDNLVAENVSSRNGTTLTFTVPSDMTPGHKTIHIEFADGEKMLGSSLWITKEGVLPPVLDRIEPAEGPYGSEVTIYGKNFSRENNEVFMMVGKQSGVVSEDGTSITFKLDPLGDVLSQYAESDIPGMEYRYPIYIMVSNEGGVSSKPVLFHITPSEYLLQ